MRLTGTSTGLFITGIYGIIKATTCICFLLLMADSLRRRRSLLWTSVAQGLAMFYIGLYVRISPHREEESVHRRGILLLYVYYSLLRNFT